MQRHNLQRAIEIDRQLNQLIADNDNLRIFLSLEVEENSKLDLTLYGFGTLPFRKKELTTATKKRIKENEASIKELEQELSIL